MNPTRATARVLEGIKADFLKRHKKARSTADRVWTDLVAKGPALERDTTLGQAIQRRLWPKAFRQNPNLYRLELVAGFRALYTVLFIAGDGHIVRIEWVGDHKEYDRLFGYATSQGPVKTWLLTARARAGTR